MNEVKKYETWNRYQGSNWNSEHGFKYILQLEDNHLVEAGYFIHYHNGKIIKSVIELPSSLGCPMKCKFCAAFAIPFIRKLNVEEELMIFNHIYQSTALLAQSPLIISFMGIGDLFFTINTVEKTILDICNRHNDIQFTVSSCHWTTEMFTRIQELYNKAMFRAVQITYISYKKDILYNVIDYFNLTQTDCYFESIVNCIKESPIAKFRINYLLLSHINDSQEDFLTFISLIAPLKDKILVRISRLNITKACEINRISVSSLEKMEELKILLEDNGIQAYLFYAINNDKIGCGQLLSETYLQDF